MEGHSIYGWSCRTVNEITRHSHAIHINLLANGSVQLCTFLPVQSFQNTVLTAYVINAHDMVGLSSQTSQVSLCYGKFLI